MRYVNKYSRYIFLVVIIFIIVIIYIIYNNSNVSFNSLDEAFSYGEKVYSGNFKKNSYYKVDKENYIVVYKNNFEFYLSKIKKNNNKYIFIKESPIFVMSKNNTPYSKYQIPIEINKNITYVNIIMLYDDKYYITDELYNKNYNEINELYIFYSENVDSYEIKK